MIIVNIWFVPNIPFVMQNWFWSSIRGFSLRKPQSWAWYLSLFTFLYLFCFLFLISKWIDMMINGCDVINNHIWISSGFLIECHKGHHHHDHKHDSAVSSVSIVSEGTLDLDEVIILFLHVPNYFCVWFKSKLWMYIMIHSLMIGLKG